MMYSRYVDTFDGSGNLLSRVDMADSLQAADVCAAQILAVKRIAYDKIVAIMPEHVQRNLLAHQIDITNRRSLGQTLTPEDEAEEVQNQALWDRAKAIRAASDAIELVLTAMTSENDVAGLLDFSIIDATDWPE